MPSQLSESDQGRLVAIIAQLATIQAQMVALTEKVDKVAFEEIKDHRKRLESLESSRTWLKAIQATMAFLLGCFWAWWEGHKK